MIIQGRRSGGGEACKLYPGAAGSCYTDGPTLRKLGSMDEIGKLLPQFLKRHIRGDRAPVLEVLTPLWPRVAGKAMARQAQPVAFGDGTLTLVTGNPSWAIELRGLREEIRAAVNRALGQPLVKQLRVRLDPRMGENNVQETAGRAAVPVEVFRSGPTDANLDPEIRAVLARSFAKYFARGSERVN